jgi:4'-phosphopantetheinyl transferase
VHVWRIDTSSLGALRERAPELERVLAPAERERAARFHRDRDRERYVAGHLALRDILGRALSRPPAQLEFAASTDGKPYLADAPGLEFNLSDSGGLALVAVTQDRAVGVDVEQLRDDASLLDVADRFFSPHEVRCLRGVDPAGQLAAFFRIWTRKEAYIKALGEGLGHDLASFDVSLEPGAGACLIATRPDAEQARRWSLSELAVGDDYAAALVVRGPLAELVTLAWEPSAELCEEAGGR